MLVSLDGFGAWPDAAAPPVPGRQADHPRVDFDAVVAPLLGLVPMMPTPLSEPVPPGLSGYVTAPTGVPGEPAPPPPPPVRAPMMQVASPPIVIEGPSAPIPGVPASIVPQVVTSALVGTGPVEPGASVVESVTSEWPVPMSPAAGSLSPEAVTAVPVQTAPGTSDVAQIVPIVAPRVHVGRPVDHPAGQGGLPVPTDTHPLVLPPPSPYTAARARTTSSPHHGGTVAATVGLVPRDPISFNAGAQASPALAPMPPAVASSSEPLALAVTPVSDEVAEALPAFTHTSVPEYAPLADVAPSLLVATPMAAPAPAPVPTPAPTIVSTSAPPIDVTPTTDDGAPLVSRLVETMRWQAREGGGQVEIRLRPEVLGAVTVSLVVRDGAVRATVVAESAAARAFLQGEVAGLEAALEARGLTLEQFDIREDALLEQRGRDDDRREHPPERQAPARPVRSDDASGFSDALDVLV